VGPTPSMIRSIWTPQLFGYAMKKELAVFQYEAPETLTNVR